MARRRYKISVYMEVYRGRKDLPPIWFQHGKPQVWEDIDHGHRFGNIRHFTTIKMARRVANGILYRWPDAAVEIVRPDRKHKREKFEVWTDRRWKGQREN